jgi:hypothetical protein
MNRHIPIGISDFKKIIEGNYYFVDKSLLIKEFMEHSADIILVPRPRRFGKTLNMSMLRYFYDINEKNKELFDGLKISKYQNCMNEHVKYPVIFISFKDEKYLSFIEFEESLKILFSHIYRDYEYLLDSNYLSKFDKDFFIKILSRQASIIEISKALKELTYYLSKHYNKKIMLFIDEYDVPIQEGYVNGYYDKVIAFMRNILSSALKDNIYVEKAMITGILRVSKESILSGLNNLVVENLLNTSFDDKFGFTEKEVEELFEYYDIKEDIGNIKSWYNGYKFGDKTIYNPWSIVNYIREPSAGVKAYWVNTSINDLIKKLLSKGSEENKKELEVLIQGNTIKKIINDNIIMTEVEEDSENIWNFLLFTGYLKASNKENIEGDLVCELSIPNREVYSFYKNIIKKWFSENISNLKYNAMLNALITGDIKTFEDIFKEFVINSISYFDVAGKEPEKVYHAFVLGMLISLSNEYYVKSNKESGYGRYDVILIPKDTSKLGIIIEFKKISGFSNNTMEEAKNEALNQINDMKYRAELLERNINDILELAIVFKGKEVEVTIRQ